jgi:hypothetical protein
MIPQGFADGGGCVNRIRFLFFAAQLFFIRCQFSFDGTNLFDREGYDIIARDGKTGSRD